MSQKKAWELIKLAEAEIDPVPHDPIYSPPPDYIRWRNEDALDEVAEIVLGRRLNKGGRNVFFNTHKRTPGDLDFIDTIASLSIIINSIENHLETLHRLRRNDDEEGGEEGDALKVFISIAKALGTSLDGIARVIIQQDEEEQNSSLSTIQTILRHKLKGDYLVYKNISSFEKRARRTAAKTFGTFTGTERDIQSFLKKWRANRDYRRAKDRNFDMSKAGRRRLYKYSDN